MSDAFPYEADTRLLRWAESSTAGRTITIELPPGDGEAHPFRGFPTGHMNGQRFKMKFIPIDDNESEIRDPAMVPGRPPQDIAVPPAVPHPAEGVSKRSVAGRERYHNASPQEQALIRAVRYPKDPKFREWIGADSESVAAFLIRAEIGGSRSLITEDPDVYDRYIKRIETPFKQWAGLMAEPR